MLVTTDTCGPSPLQPAPGSAWAGTVAFAGRLVRCPHKGSQRPPPLPAQAQAGGGGLSLLWQLCSRWRLARGQDQYPPGPRLQLSLGPSSPCPLKMETLTHSHPTSSSFFAPQNSEPENLRPGRGLRGHFPGVGTAPEERVRPGITCRKSRDRQDQNPAEVGCTTPQTLSPEPKFPLPPHTHTLPLSRPEQRAQPGRPEWSWHKFTEQVVLMGPEQRPQMGF